MTILERDNITRKDTRKDYGSHNSGSNNRIKIIVDEPAKYDALDFQGYSQNLADIIRETTPPQFSVGIFGKLGTGKTTLMRMIEKE